MTELEVESKESITEVRESSPAQGDDDDKTVHVHYNLEAGTQQEKAASLRYANSSGNFITGIDVTSEEAARKRALRAQRFNLSPPEADPGLVKLQARAQRFGVRLVARDNQPFKLEKSLPQVPTGDIRPEAVHLHGTDHMSTRDVFSYFSAYAPRNIEWINDSSCNAVWDDPSSAERALLGVGQHPVALASEFVGGGEGEVSRPQPTAHLQTSEGETSAATGTGSPETGAESPVAPPPRAESPVAPPPGVQWRLGKPHPSVKKLLLRYATTGDRKVPGAAKHSQYYRRHGKPGRRRAKEETEDVDLRGQLERKRSQQDRDRKEVEEEEGEEPMEVEPASPLVSLAKRPKPLHSDRNEDELETDEHFSESERLRRAEMRGEDKGEAGTATAPDLRKAIQKKRKRRNLQLRVGHAPRVVEEREMD